MSATSGEGDHPGQAADLDRNRIRIVVGAAGRAVAQLAVVVPPPGPDRAIPRQSEAVPAACHHACTGEIGRHGLIGGRHVQGANAVLSGACTRRPADKARNHARRSGERHRCIRVITARAVRAATDAVRCTLDQPGPTAGLGHVQGCRLDGQDRHPEQQYEQIQRPPGPQKQGMFSEGIHVGFLSWRNKTAPIVKSQPGLFEIHMDTLIILYIF